VAWPCWPDAGAAARSHAPAGLAGLSAQKIVSEATAAATAAGWVHASLTAKVGSASFTSSDVAGPSVASQTLEVAGAERLGVVLEHFPGRARHGDSRW